MPLRYRVVLTDRAWPDANIEREILAGVGAELVEAPNTQESTLIALCADADALITNWAPVTSRVIESATRCRVISRSGIGLDNIAVETATRLKVLVTNVPDYCVAEVADHTLALILACARKIAFYHARTKRGEYRLAEGPPMHRLDRQTLGLVGLGRIARNLVPKARALGLNVVAQTRSMNSGGIDCRMVDFGELLAISDFVSLHLPLTPETQHLFGPHEFERMKPTAYLINTSRGGLVASDALWQALQARQIAGAALDVFSPEPPDLTLPLYCDERVIITPHAAFVSVESIADLRTRVAQQVADVLCGHRPKNVVNLPQNDS